MRAQSDRPAPEVAELGVGDIEQEQRTRAEDQEEEQDSKIRRDGEDSQPGADSGVR